MVNPAFGGIVHPDQDRSDPPGRPLHRPGRPGADGRRSVITNPMALAINIAFMLGSKYKFPAWAVGGCGSADQ